MNSRRFDYVKYDDQATAQSEEIRKQMIYIAGQIEALGGSAEATLALRRLEESFMWVGKALKEQTIQREASVTHIPERG